MEKNVKNKKYRDIMDTARELFWKHGFRRVTVQEICAKSGVSKMTFYKYFPDKIELAKTVFTNIMDESMEKFSDLMKENISVPEKMQKMLLLKAEGTKNISQEFMNDFYLGTEPELKNFVEEKTGEVWESLLKNYKWAQKNNIFRDDFKPEFFLKVSFKLTELMNDKELTQLYDSPQELILEFAKLMTYGITKRE